MSDNVTRTSTRPLASTSQCAVANSTDSRATATDTAPPAPTLHHTDALGGGCASIALAHFTFLRRHLRSDLWSCCFSAKYSTSSSTLSTPSPFVSSLAQSAPNSCTSSLLEPMLHNIVRSSPASRVPL